MTKELIRLEGIKKVFYTDEIETWALNDINLEIEKGEFVSISGQSGCGKSTLLSVLGLLNSATEGKYFLNGEEVANQSRHQQAKIRGQQIGFIFQAFNLIGDMNVLSNVELPLTYRSQIGKKERTEMALEALRTVDMVHRKDHMPSQLSGGQQQRVAIARALVGNPSVLLADEPTGNLDSNNAEMVMSLLDKLHERGNTICMVTHDPRFAQYARRQIVLLDGRIVDDHEILQTRNIDSTSVLN